MPFAVIDLQGYFVRKAFTVKEMAFKGAGSPIFHYTFKSYFPFTLLSESDRRQIKWLVKNYHGIEYYIGGELTSNIKNLIGNFIKTYGIDIIYFQ